MPFRLFYKEKKPVPEYKIDNTCIMCGRCADECPIEAISKGDKKYVIDPEECIECGVCFNRCPVEAIKEV